MHARLLLWSLRHRRRRHAANAGIIAVTVAVVMLFVSVMTELVSFSRGSAERELARSVVTPKLQVGGFTLPASLYGKLQQIEGMKLVQRYRTVRGRHPSGATYRIVGEEEAGIPMNSDIFTVSPDVYDAWKRESRLGAVISPEVATELGLEIGKEAELPTQYGPLQIKVVGFSSGGSVGHRIAVHFEYLLEAIKDPGNMQYRIFTEHRDYSRIAKEVIAMTENSAAPAVVVSDTLIMSNWVHRVSVVPALLGFLGFFLVLTTALSLANSTAIAIRDRRIETAAMRVIGYRRRTIMRLLLSECVVVGLFGGVIAILVMVLAFGSGIQLTPGSERLLQAVTIGPLGVACGLIAAVVMPLAGALPSTLAAMRTPLVVALRDAA